MAEGGHPTGVALQMSQMQQVIADLQAQIVSLRGTERADLEHRLSAHLETRLSQEKATTIQAAQQAATTTAAVTGAAHAKPPFKPKRPPAFKGNQDGPKIQEWLLQAEVYLRAMGIENQESCVFHICSFLEADAAVWWRHYYTQMELGLVVKPTTWLDMKVLLSQQFQVFNHITEVRDRYYGLRQSGSVSTYITRFRALVVELPNEPEDSKIYNFLKGLKPEIQARTRTHKPQTLAQAMDIADEADRAQTHAHKHGVSYRQIPRPNGGGAGPQPMQLGAISPSPADLQQLRQRNACFYCRKQGHQARNCHKKKADMQKQNFRGSRRSAARKAEN